VAHEAQFVMKGETEQQRDARLVATLAEVFADLNAARARSP